MYFWGGSEDNNFRFAEINLMDDISDDPLPEGWVREINDKNGKVFYFHQQTQKSISY